MKPYYEDPFATIFHGDCRTVLPSLPDCSVNCCVTSPPYFGLRDYGVDGQLGLEPTPDEYVAQMVDVFREVRRVLRDDGTLWLNLGDSYAGSGKGPAGNLGAKHNERHLEKIHSGVTPDGLKPKDLIGIPWRVAFALQADGWYLRQDIIWHKPNPMPESVQDRCTKAHEYIFLMSKSAKYWYDADAVAEPLAESTREWGGGKGGWGPSNANHSTPQGTHGPALRGDGRCGENGDTRNKRSVWTVATQPYKGAHFAVFPPDLIKPCILAGCPQAGAVLDPFGGSGTTAAVAKDLQRHSISIELNEEYMPLQQKRLAQEVLPL